MEFTYSDAELITTSLHDYAMQAERTMAERVAARMIRRLILNNRNIDLTPEEAVFLHNTIKEIRDVIMPAAVTAYWELSANASISEGMLESEAKSQASQYISEDIASKTPEYTGVMTKISNSYPQMF